jgi:hypothetical protein
MASKYFKLFNFGKKVGPTIQGVAPKVAKTTGDKIKRTVNQIKRMTTAKTKKLSDDMQMKSKEITDTLNKMRTPKAEGGSMNDRSSAVDKAILKGVSQGIFSMDDFAKYKKTGEIPGSKKRTEKAVGGILGKHPKKKEEKKSIKEKILPKKKKDRLEELRKELKQDGGPVGRGMEARPRKPQYITRKEKPQYITKKEKPQYITKKSKFITKKKKPVQSESKYITRKEKPKYITRKEKVARPGGKALGGGPRD